MFVAGALLYQSSPKEIKICMFEITSDARIWFQMASSATLPVDVRHTQLSQGTRWWRHNCVTYYAVTTRSPTPFDSRLRWLTQIWIFKEFRQNIVWMENVIYLRQRVHYGEQNDTTCPSLHVASRGLRNFSTTIFNRTFKNCVSRRGSSKV